MSNTQRDFIKENSDVLKRCYENEKLRVPFFDAPLKKFDFSKKSVIMVLQGEVCMDNMLTKKQYLSLMDHIEWDENGNTNKKCPLCNNDIIIEYLGTSLSRIVCKTTGCVCIENRGL